jgi:hypothetical protein
LRFQKVDDQEGIMANSQWNWADLNGEQLDLLREGEQTLGADILLAYQQDQAAAFQDGRFSRSGLQAAPLNDSQLECLQGLEKNLQAVVIAYQQTR